MNSKLSEAISRVRELPEDRQEVAADILLDFLDHQDAGFELTPEQMAEVEVALSADEPYATPAEVEAFFAKFKA